MFTDWQLPSAALAPGELPEVRSELLADLLEEKARTRASPSATQEKRTESTPAPRPFAHD
jgi:hypothetical protein